MVVESNSRLWQNISSVLKTYSYKDMLFFIANFGISINGYDIHLLLINTY
jgi:hypothetical protein